MRFVVLLHQLGPQSAGPSLEHGPAHWDWMFQVDPSAANQSLRTWSTRIWPKEPTEKLSDVMEMDAIELPDHRGVYLDKQGDIGGGRGTVTRIAQGQFHSSVASADKFQASLVWSPGSDLPSEMSSDLPSEMLAMQRIVFYRIARRSWRLRLERGS